MSVTYRSIRFDGSKGNVRGAGFGGPDRNGQFDNLVCNNVDSRTTSGITLTNLGTTSLVSDGSAPDFQVKGLVEGNDISFSTSATDVTISSTATVGIHSMWVPAASMIYSVTDGAAAGQVETAVNAINYRVLLFDGAGVTKEYAHFHMAFPKSWDEGTLTFQVFWEPTTSEAVNNSVLWGLQGVFVGNDVTVDTAYGSAVEVTDSGATSGRLYVTDASGAITVGNSPAVDGVVYFRLYRDPNSDTYPADARLHGIKLFYSTDASTDI